MLIKLSEAKIKKEYSVVSILGADNISIRLKELGFVSGTKLMVTHTSILGGTKIINIRGYYLCMKNSVLTKVLVNG